MAVKTNSLVFRLVMPVFIIVLIVFSLLVISINRISGRIIDDFVSHTLSDYVDETLQIVEKAQSELVTAQLMDNPQVVDAKKRLVAEAISLYWKRRNVSGLISDDKRNVLASTLSKELENTLLQSDASGQVHLDSKNGYLHGETLNYPAWGWRMYIGTAEPASYLVRKEIYYLIPIVIAGLLTMIASLFIVLRRNLQRPVRSLISAINAAEELPKTGIHEFDDIGDALNQAVARLQVRTDELAAELLERRKAEAALQQSEERFRTTLMSVGDAIIATDSSGRVTLMNHVAVSLTGWPQDDAAGRPLEEVFNIVNEETRGVVESPVGKVLREGIVIGLANHTVLISRDGTECPVADAGAPIRDQNGNITGVVLVFRDQTEERRAEAALREEKNKSESIIAAMGDGISIQDRDFRVLYQNEVHKRIIGEHVGDICYRAYETRDEVCDGCPVAQSFIDGRVHTVQRTVSRPEGLRYFEITTSPLRDASGEIVAGIEIVRDVTAIRHGEEQLRQAQKMEGIGLLAGGIAHDFNNILTAIIGYASMLDFRINNDELKGLVTNILESAERASILTKSLLSFSRKHPADVRSIDINELITGFKGIMGRLIGEDIELDLNLFSDPLIVNVDKGQLEQALLNLITNARDAMPDGGRIGISTEISIIDLEIGDLPKGSYAVISVSDNGAGIDPKIRDHIFEPFFTTKEVGKGTGLGLSVVYGIIRNHNGSIHVYSEPGQGTTFRIYIPLSESAAAEAAETVGVHLPGGTETILLVEDNEETRKVAAMLLKEFGYTVLEAVDGECIQKQHGRDRPCP